jgi:hypothetical protein
MTEDYKNLDAKKKLGAAIDAACGTCKKNPIDADVIRKDSNESDEAPLPRKAAGPSYNAREGFHLKNKTR